MKSILTTAGMVALGAVTIHGQSSLETSKPWNVSAVLNGFYDDNYVTRPSHSANGANARDSFGFEISPRASYHPQLENSSFGVSYQYGLKYFADRDSNRTDQSHEFDLQAGHEFTPHVRASMMESFAIAQEPDIIIGKGGISPTPLRLNGDNYRNDISGTAKAQLTGEDQLEVEVTLRNQIYDYQDDHNPKVNSANPADRGPSYSALLDRSDNSAVVDLRYKLAPQTGLHLGYVYDQVDFSSKDPLLDIADPVFVASGNPVPYSSWRNTRSHTAFAGVDTRPTPTVGVNVRGGASFVEYPDNPTNTDHSEASPYADASVTWNYVQGSSAQFMVKYNVNTTDLTGLTSAASSFKNLTLDQEQFTVFGGISHALTANLQANLRGYYIISTLRGGSYDGFEEQMFMLTAGLTQKINQFLSAEATYYFDVLKSDVPDRGFDRNRIFVGIRGTY